MEKESDGQSPISLSVSPSLILFLSLPLSASVNKGVLPCAGHPPRPVREPGEASSKKYRRYHVACHIAARGARSPDIAVRTGQVCAVVERRALPQTPEVSRRRCRILRNIKTHRFESPEPAQSSKEQKTEHICCFAQVLQVLGVCNSRLRLAATVGSHSLQRLRYHTTWIVKLAKPVQSPGLSHSSTE